MAERRVVAYYMHETERDACTNVLHNATWSSGHVSGTVADEDIAGLESAGIIVEVVDDEPTTRGGLESFGVAGAAEELALTGPPLEPVLHPSQNNVFSIEIDGPFLMPTWHQALVGLGVELLERLPSGRFNVYLSLGQVAQVRSLPFVRDVRLFAPVEAASAVFTQIAATRGLGAAPEAQLFDILLHRPTDAGEVSQWLADNGVAVVASGKRKLRVALPGNSMLPREIEAQPGVRRVMQYVEPTLANEVARQLLGLDPAPNPHPGAPNLTETGKGEIVAVADSGIDAAHPDFAGRIAGTVARARPGDSSDLHGHGTHVAGSVLGDGAHKGAAPEAQLFFQSIMNAADKLTGLPVDLGDLFDEAYQAGARIHNNSWSANTKSFYTFNALEVDEFVETHPDMLITIAAGNEGTAAASFNAAAGFVDWQSIGSPATAKNALTVGASRSQRTTGGWAASTYGTKWPARFPDPPSFSDSISGDPQSLAAFSSRGPCDPHRIKPDLVAPGTDILSARAATAPNGNFWALGDSGYAYLGGTSMATPLVSGCAALVRQYYRDRGHTQPSAALLKATLVNSTRQLTGPGAIADHAKLPNFHQGFGAVHMPYAIPNAAEPWFQLHFIDTWNGTGGFAPNGRDRMRLAFVVRGGPFLRLCLTWTDPAAGPGLQNVLAPILEHSGLMPPKRLGNEDRPMPVGKVDRDNNVQIIRIESPPAGNYLLQVFAANLLGPQDWALVVTGDLDGGLVEV